MLNQGTHPLAGASMTGADMLVQVLADEGVDTIFGYSGGAILPIYDAVFRYNQDNASSMPLIVPANEQGAGAEHHGCRCEACIPDHRSDQAGGDRAHRVRDRTHRPARPRGPRRPER